MSEYAYRVIYEPLIEGDFQVIVPALPGIVTYGSTPASAKRTNLVAVGNAHGSRWQRHPDPERVEQVNSTGIVRHIRLRIHPGIESALLEMFAFYDGPSGCQDIVSSQGPSTVQSKSLHNHLANESF